MTAARHGVTLPEEQRTQILGGVRGLPPHPEVGETYFETDYKHDWSRSTGELMAANLVAVAKALAATPIPAPS